MSYLPCKNPSCKSHGQPHPNCRCYGDMAEGGDVSFCSSERKHETECQYFVDGGEVIDPSQVVIDEPIEEEIPADQVVIDEPVSEDIEIPADQVVIDEPGAENEDLSLKISWAKMVSAAHPEGLSKYESPGHQIGSVAEGIARGIAGPAATLAETKILGIPQEDILGREQANPIKSGAAEAAGFVGSLATGVGEIGLMTKAAEAAANYAKLGKVGSGILKGALSNGLISATDETSKMLLGQNPEQPVAAVLASAGLGGFLGGVGSKAASFATKQLSELSENKLGTRVQSWLAGLGSAASPDNEKIYDKAFAAIDKNQFSQKSFDAGAKYYKKLMDHAMAPAALTGALGSGVAALHGYHQDGIEGALTEGGISVATGLAGGLGLKYAGKYLATPVILKLLSSGNTSGFLEALDHAEKVAKGVKAIDTGIEGLFGKAAASTAKAATHRKELEEWIDGGGSDQDLQQEIHDQHAPPETQGFADGGDVKPVPKRENGVANHFPEQNIIMQAAKARASGYLNSLRPTKNQAKLAFDADPDDRQQKKTYKRALDVAASPLSILDHIQKGTIEPEHIKHLNAMFPEVTSLLQQKATERIVKAQVDGKKPSYKVRQGLSMLLGTPLSGELKPQNIQAAQAVFAKVGGQTQPNQPQQKKPNSNTLSKSDRAYLTDDQARQQRQQRSS